MRLRWSGEKQCIKALKLTLMKLSKSQGIFYPIQSVPLSGKSDKLTVESSTGPSEVAKGSGVLVSCALSHLGFGCLQQTCCSGCLKQFPGKLFRGCKLNLNAWCNAEGSPLASMGSPVLWNCWGCGVFPGYGIVAISHAGRSSVTQHIQVAHWRQQYALEQFSP